jgi:ubiquinone/menaquinone biosynthesis C-methylase UbiE
LKLIRENKFPIGITRQTRYDESNRESLMSQFSNKILNGTTPTDEDWSEHLVEAHKIAPSMTPYAFSPYKTASGLNSYELLAGTVASLASKDATVLDLACGDGHLIPLLLKKIGGNGKVVGVDMSDGELAIARNSVQDPRVTFFQTKAQSIPLPDYSVDHVVCHMAFMLMLPVESVVAELSRILKPQGKFSAVIGGTSQTGLYLELRQSMFQFIISRYPKVKEARVGDPRTASLNGLRELFRADLGFAEVESLVDFDLEVHTKPEGIWDLMKDLYFVAILPESEKSELRSHLISIGARNVDALGVVHFKFPMKTFTAIRKS